MSETITVHYNDKPIYDIVIRNDFDKLAECVSNLGISGRKLCIITDSNVAPLYADEVKALLEIQTTAYLYLHLTQERKIKILILFRMHMNF